jgi:hypothetical protein
VHSLKNSFLGHLHGGFAIESDGREDSSNARTIENAGRLVREFSGKVGDKIQD